MNTQWIKNASRLMAGAASLAIASIAAATTVTLSPYSATSPPATAAVDVGISEVAHGKAVGAYDIAIRYDASLWSPTSVDFGTFLSGPDPLGSIQAFDLSIPGLVQLLEISLVTPLDPQPLETLQPDSFSFATIHFAALAQGTGSFEVVRAAVFDQLGDALAVPEPQTLALLLFGLGVIVTGANRRAWPSMG